MVLSGVTTNDDVLAGDLDIDGDMVELAFVVMLVRGVDTDLTAHDLVAESLEFFGLLAHSRFDGGRGIHVVYGNFQWYGHLR